jgi:Domain of unknown function (DUF1929)
MRASAAFLPPMAPSRARLVSSAALLAALFAMAAPGAAFAHEATTTVRGHVEEDSVVHEPGVERQLQRRTSSATSSDAAAAAAAVAGNEAEIGLWGPVANWPVVGIHVALLENGKVLAYDSVNDSQTGPHNGTRATVWDPATGAQTPVNVTTGYNVFCSGLAHLADGSILLAGGNKNPQLDGIAQTHIFNPATNRWSLGPNMATERWYPSVTPLNNGEMLITDGVDAGPDTPEVRKTDGGLRALNTASLDLPLYPWMDVAPNGRAFYSGPNQTMRSLNPAGGGSWQTFAQRDSINRTYGSRAVYDVGKILVAGGGNSTSDARVINLNGATPQVSQTAPMANGRRQHNLTVLADGTVLATGGNSSGVELIDMNNAVYAAELWNPATGTWSTLAAEQVTRQYHSTALLLPDARVLSAGGGICGACDAAGYLAKNAQVFTPPYLFRNDGSGQLAARPQITAAPGALPYNAPFWISTPSPASIGKVALVRLGAVTHSVNMEQRYVPLSFTAGAGTINASSPANANIAPPGVYMLFVIGTDGVPSVARMVHIDPNAPAPPPPPAPPNQPASTPGSIPGQLSGGTTGPRRPGATNRADSKAPVLNASIKRRQRVLRAGAVVARAGCDEACTLTGWGRLRIGRSLYELGRSQTPQASRTAVLKLRLSRRATRALRRALQQRRQVTAQITLRAQDAAGNRSSLVRATVQAVR